MIAWIAGEDRRDSRGGLPGDTRGSPTPPSAGITTLWGKTNAAVATVALAAGARTAGATPAAAAPTNAQTVGGGGIPIVGPTVILLGALLFAMGLRLVERRYGSLSSLGSDAPDTGTDGSTGQSTTTGSTAGREIESSAARDTDETDLGPAAEGATPPAMTESSSDDRVEHASGTFRTVEGGGTLMVTNPGFEPDLIVLTGASKGPASETGFAEGWSHGIAHRTSTGNIDQYAVSIADTAGETTGGGIREDAALDVPITAEGAGTDAVWGKVATTVDEGFQFEVSVPSGHDRTSTVQYHAISFPEGTDVSVGTFGFGSEPRKGKVDLGVDADFVSVTATTGARPLTRDPERAVALSHGTVVDRGDDPSQSTVGSALDGTNGSYVAHDDRAIYLLHPGDDGIAGRTSMNVTALGSTMRLTLEDIHEPAPVAFAVYAAVSMPEEVPPPVTGLTPTPGHEPGTRNRVQTEFTPATVSLSASTGAVDDEARTIPGSLPMLGWSHGVVGGSTGGLAGQIPIRTLVDGERIVRNPLGTGIDDDAFVLAAMEEFEGELPLLLYTAWPGEFES